MSEDIFAIKELRDIILAFPPSTTGSQDSVDTRLPNLVNAASGDALWLTDQLRKRVLAELQARQRLVLSTFAQQLDIGSRDLLSLLAEPEVRPRWCYNSGIHSVVPQAELVSLLQTLCDTCSQSFVDYQICCQQHDLNPEDFRGCLRRFNGSVDDRKQLGIGRWYDDSEAQSKPIEYVYFESLLESSRSHIRERLREATENHQSIDLGHESARGLDGSSFLYFVRKVLDELFDFNTDFTEKCELVYTNDCVTFTPPTAVVAEKQRRVQQFIERSNGWRNSGKPAAEHIPCLPLWSAGQDASESIEENLSQARKILKEINSSERLVKLSDYAVTYRALRTVADHLLANLEVSPSVLLNAPKDVDAGRADEYLSDLYDTIVTEFSTDADLITRIDQYISLSTSVATAKKSMIEEIERQAQKAWEGHANLSTSIPFPETAPASTLPEAATATAPSGQTGFYETVVRLGSGAQRKKDAVQPIWKASVSACESTYEARFAAAYSLHVLSRVDLYNSGLKMLDAGKLRTELTALLVDYLISSFLVDVFRGLQDKLGLKPCGRHVEPAITKLNSQLGSFGERSQDPAEDIEKILVLLQTCGAKIKAPRPSPEQLASQKAQFEEEAIASAASRKGDKDGSRAFLCVVLTLWARRKDGFLYATGRFVPRLLKSLKENISDAKYARLQELKEVVKSGSMSDEQRRELVGLATLDERT